MWMLSDPWGSWLVLGLAREATASTYGPQATAYAAIVAQLALLCCAFLLLSL